VLQGLDIQALEAFGWAVALFLSTLAVVFSIRAAWKRGLGGFFSFLPSALAALDGFLVNRVTFLFGTRWNKFRHAGLVRWSHLTILLFGLALTTALAPLPLAYAAAALGLIGVIAISGNGTGIRRIGVREFRAVNAVSASTTTLPTRVCLRVRLSFC
jgi:uncharacterized membrane protein YozB (DUF420 family)